MSKEVFPEKRFPEFVNEEGWAEERLSMFLQFQTGFPFSSSEFNEAGDGLRLIKNRDLKSDDKPVFFSGVFDQNYIVKNGDILIGMDGDFTPIEWQKGNALLNQRVGRIKTFDAAEKKFFHYYLAIQLKLIEEKTARTTVKHLSHSDVENVSNPIPKNPKERQKIADCLSSLDDVITAQTQKLELLKAHKKGLMQDLFPADGESVPRLRFGEFEGEWEEKKLRDVCNLNPSAGYLPDEFIYIDLESVENGFLLKRNLIPRDGAPSRAQRLLKNKDIIFQTVRPYQKNNLYFAMEDGRSYVASTGYAQLRAYESEKFLFQYIHTDRFVDKVLEKCTGSNYPAINSSALAEIQVKIPSNIAEQQKIADCLSSLDDQIQAQTQKIESLKLHKKGLMQQLFPNPNP